MSIHKLINTKNILNETESSMPDGRTIKWLEIDLPNEAIESDEKNIRWGGKELTEEEQLSKIKEESPKEFQNLKNSLKSFPTASEPIIGYYNKGMSKIKKIHGHRRGVAASEAGIPVFRALIALDISDETVKFLRDHPEANPSKVFHTNYSKARMVYNELKDPSNKDIRAERVAIIAKRTGLKRNQNFNS